MDVTGVLLAGGAGRRMGGPKALTLLAGETLVERGVRTLAARCATVIVVTRPGIPLPRLDATVVMDRPGPDAPLTGIATGLAAAATDRVLVLGCDLPFAAPLLDRLRTGDGGNGCVAVDAEGTPQPLCALYPRDRALAEAERMLAAGELRARLLPGAVQCAPVPAADDELMNINTPGDLVRAAARRPET